MPFEMDSTISIHAPREGGRPETLVLGKATIAQFQSTPPARGATGAPSTAWPGSSYFNPRPLRGGRLRILGMRLLLR